MKYKFYENNFEFNVDTRKWPDEACKNTWNLYRKEIHYLAEHLSLDINKIKVDDMTFGDPVVFYDSKYFCYLDSLFYLSFDGVYEFSDWWEFENTPFVNG